MDNNKIIDDNKIALVTCYFQLNYGSQLQAYATQLYFDKLGIKNETICIDGLKAEINHAKYKYFLSRIFDAHTIADKMATVRKLIAKKVKGEEFNANLRTRELMFQDFATNRFHVSQRYNSKSELTANASRYTAFVVGSDQLWLPSNIEADYYTLNFVPENICKIAFATSFGVPTLPKKQAQKAVHFLKRLDYISIREKTGQKLVKELTGLNVPVVCDPTIMFTAEEWSHLLSPSRFYEDKYVFCYFLGNNPEQREFVRKVKELTGYKIVQLQFCDEYIASDESFPDYAPYNVGPAEFVQLIRDAEYVFTDSFHASVFSLLFAKKFFTFRRYHSDSPVSTNNRLYDLLSLVHQEQRLLTSREDVQRCLDMTVDYAEVHCLLDEKRQFTDNWLKDCLYKSKILK